MYHPRTVATPPSIRRTRGPVYGPKPGFNEESRAISTEAIERAMIGGWQRGAAGVPMPARCRQRPVNDDGPRTATIAGDTRWQTGRLGGGQAPAESGSMPRCSRRRSRGPGVREVMDVYRGWQEKDRGVGPVPCGYEVARTCHDNEFFQGRVSRRAGKPRHAHLERDPLRVGPADNPPDFDGVRRRYLVELHGHSGRNVILYASGWLQREAPPGLVSIGDEDMQAFMEVSQGLEGNELDLILHSPGGSPEAAEAIVSYLRSRFSHIRVIVPQLAMSAATMVACAADEIALGKHSFLGPTDPQLVLQTALGTRAVPAQAVLDQFDRAQRECVDPAKLSAVASDADPIRTGSVGAVRVCARNVERTGHDVAEDLHVQRIARRCRASRSGFRLARRPPELQESQQAYFTR